MESHQEDPIFIQGALEGQTRTPLSEAQAAEAERVRAQRVQPEEPATQDLELLGTTRLRLRVLGEVEAQAGPSGSQAATAGQEAAVF